MTPKLRCFLAAMVSVTALDQGAKQLVQAKIPYRERVSLIPDFFDLTHVRNPGAAFGFFESAPERWRLAAFVAVSSVALFVVISFLRRLAPGDRRNAIALGLILGGTVGNLVDRVWRGEVIDLLHVRLWGGFAWPDFNFADVGIVVGVATLIVELLVSEAASRAHPPGPSD